MAEIDDALKTAVASVRSLSSSSVFWSLCFGPCCADYQSSLQVVTRCHHHQNQSFKKWPQDPLIALCLLWPPRAPDVVHAVTAAPRSLPPVWCFWVPVWYQRCTEPSRVSCWHLVAEAELLGSTCVVPQSISHCPLCKCVTRKPPLAPSKMTPTLVL